MFVVIAVIGALLAVLVPAIRVAREEARQSTCSNNLKYIVIALQNYHDIYKVFPMGAMHSGINPGGAPPVNAALGPSWWFGIGPITEQNNWYDQILGTQRPGGPAKHQFCADDMNAYMASLPRAPNKGKIGTPSLSVFVPYYMRCPSSSLPTMETSLGPIALPSYVGIAGGCDIDPNSQDYQTAGGTAALGLVPPETVRVYQNKAKGTGAAAGGIVTSSGMLPPCQQLKISECTDGTSNTMIVAEQSGWLRDRNAKNRTQYHGDPGWTVGGTGPGGGFLSGTTRVDPVPLLETPGGPPKPWGADCWNITTVRYPPNLKGVLGATPLPGCSENHGINNPLQSPHPGGLLAGFVDGTVQFISEDADFVVLLWVAIRNDGLAISVK
jgi:type II secretory pathway pseudopilin PulG